MNMNHTMLKSIVCVSLFLFSARQAFASITVPSEKAKTLNAAMALAKKSDTIWVESGIYKEHIFLTPGVVLMSKVLFKAVIDGAGKGTVVTMGNGSMISGFEIRNGTIGIFSTTAGARITQCRILSNQQSGVMCVGNLPQIEDNIIGYNRGSGIQGWDVRATSASISHNTIAYNANHGISIGGNSSIIIENNIIAFNDQFGIKPSEETVRLELSKNSFYENAKFSGVLPDDNFSLNPAFIDSKRLNFMLGKDSQCIGRASDNQNLGARIVY